MTPFTLSPLAEHVLKAFTYEQVVEFEERCGIHEFDGHATRQDAELMAYREIFKTEPPECG